MFFKSVALVVAVAGTALGQERPSNVSICDYYTTALLKNNTAENQKTLLTLVVNTVVIGNYTKPNVGIAVPGILAPGNVNGVEVNLAPYFTGALASTNTGEMAGRAVNFLDGGGAEPLKMNMAANNTDSRQYRLLTHLYEYFGALLQCSHQGGEAFPAYGGDASQYQVHKFMALSNAEVTYFITQVGLSAASFGVARSDITAVGTALAGLFGVRCGPETTVIPDQGAQLQSICTEEDCPLAANATCAAYEAVVEPAAANSTNTEPTGSGSASASGTATGSGTASGTASRTSGATTSATANVAGGFGSGAGFAAAVGAVGAALLL